MDTCIDFTLPQGASGARLRQRFGAARAVWAAHAPGEVRAVLDAAEDAARAGAWCVGFVRYEAAAAFEPALATHAADGPLAWFAVYDEALPWEEGSTGDAAHVAWRSSLQREDFNQAMARIHEAIADGVFYQVNYTAPLHGELLQGSAEALFAALLRAQPGGYAACIDTGDEQILSVSPELFFDWDGRRILARPMKGTAPRGATPEEDEALAERLRSAPKERAENVMVVDLLRNDLSRIAEPFSVQVPRLFHTQALPSVWQMTSDVQARTRPGTRLADVFAALFPCGSVTGAPKVAAMRMIQALEPHPRGVYCGALGVLRPAGVGRMHATFNVPIRTLALRGTQAVCGIGSGITSGADAEGEWREWQHKRAFVERASQPFELLETLALEDGAWRHLPEHLQRLQDAARHFSYPWSAQVGQCLDELAAAHPAGLWRVRLQLDAQGRARAEAFACAPTLEPVRLQLAAAALEDRWTQGEFVRYKTSRRAHYEAFAPQDPAVFDTVLFNARGEITEGTRGNVAALLDGRWITPPPACGLLPGVGRAIALREGRVREGMLRLEDLPRVQAWAFVNSLRGWLAAELELPR
ncbi:aminodeoxychorismate synthase component I [Comamonas endophytica]|uniref:Aminodeoxychorismate synthase component I n=1 Tax=Comamonas endophytica TaxID=2949090 RepID=A0ABY6G6U7_9BURK|nr:MULTISPECIES: aminodeoxychorismate synthase component I [unclassified Acidovorax]MCD2511350.1 aminodeoxychorismate synthase component I [Acidovorax sp. D4N7]UYG50744.1 aminodeoxychorismate synthase component I [Acidovorax sp. 5MLIR]